MTWKKEEVSALFELSFMDLVYRAHQIHREHFDPNELQVARLCNIKKGLCPEDCGYCSQSVHYNTDLTPEGLMSLDEVIAQAKQAKADGATRFCLAAAWRNPPKRQFAQVLEMVKAVKSLGLESCVTLGMLSDEQAKELKAAGLDFYNHNLDTSPEYYEKIISTRTYQDRLDTLERVREADISVCSGGILGMGESREDRVGLLLQLANMPKHPQSVPINLLEKIPGTPQADSEDLDPFELIRTIAVARIMMPKAYIRLTAGRRLCSDAEQAWCFFAGANSIFSGEMLTVANCELSEDSALFKRLGLIAQTFPQQNTAVEENA